MLVRVLLPILLLTLPSPAVELEEIEVAGIKPGALYATADEFREIHPARVQYNRPF